MTVPSSKSHLHRLLIVNAFREDPAEIRWHGELCDDVKATISCIDALKRARPGEEAKLECKESGSTLRFMIPVVGALGKRAVFMREGRLPERPLKPFDDVLREHGMRIEADGAKLHVSGKLRGGVFSMSGNVSSQFFSALLMAFAIMDEPAELKTEGEMGSAAYFEMTRRVLANPPRGVVYAEGDWSSAAAFVAMGVRVEGLDPDSLQPDRAVAAQLASIGGTISADQAPDLVPVVAAAAAIRPVQTRIVNASRLRLKESDRLAATARLLNSLGGDVKETADGLIVNGRETLSGGVADTQSDHRLAFAAAVAATRCRKPVTVLDANCVAKSYPEFWKHFDALSIGEAPK